MESRRYLRFYFAFFLVLFFAAAAANYVVDPYDLGISLGRNAAPIKPETASHGRVHKAYALRNLKPAVLALGASRTEAGISMAHPGWAATADERYNSALTAANMGEILSYYRYATRIRPAKQVVIGLEFYSFNANLRNRGDHDESILAASDDGRLLGFDLHKAKYYFSLDALLSSYRTVTTRQAIPHFLTDGQLNPEAAAGVLRAYGGHFPAFVQSEREAVQFYLPPPGRKYGFSNGSHATFQDLRAILDDARRHGTDLRLFISPAHARHLEIIRALGLWGEYERWLRSLVELVAAEAAFVPGAQPFTVWDFTGYNSITVERVPRPEQRGNLMHWYWESSHYKTELGDLVLDRIFDHRDPSRPLPNDFGVRLTSSNLEGHLANVRRRQGEYQRANQADVAEIEALARTQD
jgi:hypothetical protein